MSELAHRPAFVRVKAPTAPCLGGCCPGEVPLQLEGPAQADRDRWARQVVLLALVSLAWMTAEGGLGLLAGARSGSVALMSWALSSVLEGLASALVIWRFTGGRSDSDAAERRAQRLVAVSFWLLAPYVAIQSVAALLRGDSLKPSLLGLVLTGSSVLVMPLLGWTKQRLGAKLDSLATRGEGTQNWMCAALAGAVLIGLATNAATGATWPDPVIGLLIAGVAIWEGVQSWRGEGCC
jgi:divalent metal cation (Fe/Co/Zn/Cd) transporter